MTKQLIRYHSDSCEHCLKCMRACPTEAICRIGKDIEIDNDKCIGCGHCIEVCEKNVLKVENAHISQTLHLYDYTVALVSGSFFADFTSEKEAGRMLKAIQNLGFDEVIDYSDVEGALYLEAISRQENADGLKIASFCPCINWLIQKHFPMLMEQIMPLEYPVEVAAKRVRERLAGKYEKVGIYSLCDCIAKKFLAKEPFGDETSNVDYAMSLSHIFPKANRAKDEDSLPVHLCKEGISSVVSDFYHYYQGMRPILSVTGIEQCRKTLELVEFGQLDEIGLLGLFACPGGCIGGQYLWDNALCGRMHMDHLAINANREVADLKPEWIAKQFMIQASQQENFKEKMQRFKRINTILESLPQFDCGACGYPNCRVLAEAIYNGKATDQACRVKKEGGEIHELDGNQRD